MNLLLVGKNMNYLISIFSLVLFYTFISPSQSEDNLQFPSQEEIVKNLKNPIHKQIALDTRFAKEAAHKRTSAVKVSHYITSVCFQYNMYSQKIIFENKDVQEATEEIIKTAHVIKSAKL